VVRCAEEPIRTSFQEQQAAGLPLLDFRTELPFVLAFVILGLLISSVPGRHDGLSSR